MVRIQLLDGTTEELSRTELRALKPFRPLMQNPRLKSDGLLYENGRLYPVYGPLPNPADDPAPGEKPWLLFGAHSARVIRGLPTFSDDLDLGIVPVRAKPAQAAGPQPVPAEATVHALPPPLRAARSEEEEEAQLMQELEDLLKVA